MLVEFNRRRAPLSVFAAVSAVMLMLMQGCGAIGALDGSQEVLEVPADATPSDYVPPEPLTQIVDGLLGRKLDMPTGGGIQVEQWSWVVGPGIQTGGASFPHAVLVEVIGGSGSVSTDDGSVQKEQRFSGGDAFYIFPSSTAVFENSSDMQIDIRATYFLDPAFNPG